MRYRESTVDVVEAMKETKHDDVVERRDEDEESVDTAGDPDPAAEVDVSADADTQPVEEPEAGEGAEADTVETELEGVRAELSALEERHLRLAAEFDNYRKRIERERVDQWARSQAQLVAELLEALDDLERVAHVDVEATSVDALLEGVQLVERKLKRALEAAGLEPLDAQGKVFDPSMMDALMTVPTPEEEAENTVADVFQKGYRFKDLLVRPAKVRVHKYDPEAGDA